MNREIGKFKAKELDTDNWVIGYYFRDTDNLHYIIGLDNYHYSIDPSTLCQLITKIGDVEIYEYDCFVTPAKNTEMFYYNDLGLLMIHTKYGICIADYQDIEKKQYRFTGNRYDGEEYLLNKIKEVQND
jgi:hypothetical protein